MKVKKLFALLLAALLSLCLCSCWEEETEEDFWETGLTAEAEPPPAEEEAVTAFTLPYLSNRTLDPITCQDGVQQTVGKLLYEGLFELDETFTAQKVLCSRYTYDAETCTYRFWLRSGVTFSDGSPLTPEDALETYQRAADSERYGARFAAVASMRLEGNALLMVLSKPNSAFPNLLDIPIVKAGQKADDIPLGTGPYLFVTESGEASLLKNSDWWQKKTLPLERIELAAIRDNETAAYLFSSRSISMLVSDLTGTEGAVSSGSGDEISCIGTTLLYLGFNTYKAPFHSAAVRSALSAALNREDIASILLAGHAQSTMLPIPQDAALCPPSPAQKSVSDYLSALEDAEVTAQTVRSMTILVNEENDFKVSIAESICRRFSCEALKLSVKKLSWSEYTAALRSGSFDLYLGEVRLTADWDLSSLIGSYGALNYGGFSDAKTDALLSAFLADENVDTAQAFCSRFSEMTPIAPLAFKAVSVLTSEGLADGMHPTASNPFYRFSDWQFHFD